MYVTNCYILNANKDLHVLLPHLKATWRTGGDQEKVPCARKVHVNVMLYVT